MIYIIVHSHVSEKSIPSKTRHVSKSKKHWLSYLGSIFQFFSWPKINLTQQQQQQQPKKINKQTNNLNPRLKESSRETEAVFFNSSPVSTRNSIRMSSAPHRGHGSATTGNQQQAWGYSAIGVVFLPWNKVGMGWGLVSHFHCTSNSSWKNARFRQVVVDIISPRKLQVRRPINHLWTKPNNWAFDVYSWVAYGCLLCAVDWSCDLIPG